MALEVMIQIMVPVDEWLNKMVMEDLDDSFYVEDIHYVLKFLMLLLLLHYHHYIYIYIDIEK